MSRVSKETISKLTAFIDSLPEEARNKCALCNETLTHIVKQAEVQTGAGTATVTKALSDKINEGSADGDRVSGGALRQRVLDHSGEKKRICSNGTNSSPPSEPATRKQKENPTNVAKKSNSETKTGGYVQSITSQINPPTDRGGKRKKGNGIEAQSNEQMSVPTHRKINKKRAWSKVAKDLFKIMKYMQENCDSGEVIDKYVSSKIQSYFSIIEAYVDDMRGE